MVARFTVEEREQKKALNTPGGEALEKQLGGPAGLPYFAFLDSAGRRIVNSTRPGKDGKEGGNIGYPSEPFEIDWFMAMLSKAVPQMTAGERTTLENRLRAKGRK